MCAAVEEGAQTSYGPESIAPLWNRYFFPSVMRNHWTIWYSYRDVINVLKRFSLLCG